jgi:hypothetical protein
MMRGLVVEAAALLVVRTGIVGAPSARADDYPAPTGGHLRYEVRLGGVPTGPVRYITDRGVQVGC